MNKIIFCFSVLLGTWCMEAKGVVEQDEWGCTIPKERPDGANNLSRAQMRFYRCLFWRYCIQSYDATTNACSSNLSFGNLKFGQDIRYMYPLGAGEKEAWAVISPEERPQHAILEARVRANGDIRISPILENCVATNELDFSSLGREIELRADALYATCLTRKVFRIGAAVQFYSDDFSEDDARQVVAAAAALPEILSCGELQRSEIVLAKRTSRNALKSTRREKDDWRVAMVMSNALVKVEISSGVDNGLGFSLSSLSVGTGSRRPFLKIFVTDLRLAECHHQEYKTLLKYAEEFQLPSLNGVDLSGVEQAISLQNETSIFKRSAKRPQIDYAKINASRSEYKGKVVLSGIELGCKIPDDYKAVGGWKRSKRGILLSQVYDPFFKCDTYINVRTNVDGLVYSVRSSPILAMNPKQSVVMYEMMSTLFNQWGMDEYRWRRVPTVDGLTDEMVNRIERIHTESDARTKHGVSLIKWIDKESQILASMDITVSADGVFESGVSVEDFRLAPESYQKQRTRENAEYVIKKWDVENPKKLNQERVERENWRRESDTSIGYRRFPRAKTEKECCEEIFRRICAVSNSVYYLKKAEAERKLDKLPILRASAELCRVRYEKSVANVSCADRDKVLKGAEELYQKARADAEVEKHESSQEALMDQKVCSAFSLDFTRTYQAGATIDVPANMEDLFESTSITLSKDGQLSEVCYFSSQTNIADEVSFWNNYESEISKIKKRIGKILGGFFVDGKTKTRTEYGEYIASLSKRERENGPSYSIKWCYLKKTDALRVYLVVWKYYEGGGRISLVIQKKRAEQESKREFKQNSFFGYELGSVYEGPDVRVLQCPLMPFNELMLGRSKSGVLKDIQLTKKIESAEDESLNNEVNCLLTYFKNTYGISFRLYNQYDGLRSYISETSHTSIEVGKRYDVKTKTGIVFVTIFQ